MNLYLVVSEDVGASYELYEGTGGPPEACCICNAVAARTHSQARWLAWRNDKEFEPTFSEMPRLRCQLRAKTVAFPAGVLADEDVPEGFDWELDERCPIHGRAG